MTTREPMSGRSIRVRLLGQIGFRGRRQESMILLVSLHYVLLSLLVVPQVKGFIHVGFLPTALATFVVAAAVVAMMVSKVDGKLGARWKTPRSMGTHEIYFVIGLFVLAFVVLLPNMLTTPVSVDEPYHIMLMRLALTQPWDEYIASMSASRILYSPWCYVVIGQILRLAGGVTLLGARIVTTTASSLAAVATYYLAKEMLPEGLMPVITSCVFVFSSISHDLLFYATMDGIAALLFTISVCFVLRGLTRLNSFCFLLAGLFWSLLALAHYFPALQLFFAYALSLICLHRKRAVRARDFASMCVGCLLFPVINFQALTLQISTFLELGLQLIPILNPIQYDPTMLWDLLLSVGWSPYVVFLLVAAKQSTHTTVQSRLKAVSTIIVGSGFLVYLLLNSWAIMRRLAPVAPLFLSLVTGYSTRNYSKITTFFVLLNFCWWGLLKLSLSLIFR